MARDATMRCSSPGCRDGAGTDCQRCGRAHCFNHVFALHKPGLVQFFCRECIQGGPHAPRATVDYAAALKPPRAKRQPSQAMTFLAFCKLCQAEVYRLEHVRRRTKQVKERIELEPKLAWTKHALTMRQMGGATGYEHNPRHWYVGDRKTGERRPEANVIPHLIQTAWVAEDLYDPSLQVGDPQGEVLPERYRMLNVIKELAGGIGYGIRHLTEEEVAGLQRFYGDTWDDPDDPDAPEGAREPV